MHRIVTPLFRIRRWSTPLLLTAALAVLLLSLVRPALAQRATAYVSADTVTVGQRFELALVIERDVQQLPVLPDEAVPDTLEPGTFLALGDVEVIRRKLLTHRDLGLGGASQLDSVVYEVTTFALDTAFVPAIPILFTADADTFTVATQPLMVPVRSLVPPDAEGIHDLAPLAEFPRSPWPWVLGTMALLAVLTLLYYYWRKRREAGLQPAVAAAAARPPYEEAMERLRSLEQADLYTPDAIKPYFIELSDTLRQYLAHRLGLEAMEHTTTELVRDLRRVTTAETIPHTVERGVKQVLELSDFAKFADAKPPPEQSRWALKETFSTLEDVERALRVRAARAAAAAKAAEEAAEEDEDSTPVAPSFQPAPGPEKPE